MEEGHTRTLILADARSQERCLRVTWHPDTQTVVFSHWQGPVCSASTPVPVSETSGLVELLIEALRRTEAVPPLQPAGGPVASGPYERGE